MTAPTATRQQLFHWVGSHLETKSGKLTAAKRDAYIDCLRDVLCRGLWLKLPREEDFLPGGGKVDRPIVCFSEWDLRGSGEHREKYGRLGFGFSKRFVLARGGHPVSYAYENAGPSRAFKRVRNQLRRAGVGLEELDYLAHFTKRVRPVHERPQPLSVDGPAANARRKRKPSGTSAASSDRDFVRPWGPVLGNYLEEREWRIAYAPHLDGKVEATGHEPAGRTKPAYRLRFHPGRDLFTVVLPDNATVYRALQDPEIRDRLQPVEGTDAHTRRPHVTPLSLDDVPTF